MRCCNEKRHNSSLTEGGTARYNSINLFLNVNLVKKFIE